jgi:hypothetical protein
MAGITLGGGARGSIYSGSQTGGTVGGSQVFRSPITPDLQVTGKGPQDYPAAWVMIGLAGWILLVGFHFYHY